MHRQLILNSKPRQEPVKFERSSSQRYIPRQSHLQKQKFRQEVCQQLTATVASGSKDSNYGNVSTFSANKIVPNGFNNEKKSIKIASGLKNDSTSSTTTSGYNSTTLTSSSTLNLENAPNAHVCFCI